jgi:hypothetical protein
MGDRDNATLIAGERQVVIVEPRRLSRKEKEEVSLRQDDCGVRIHFEK